MKPQDRTRAILRSKLDATSKLVAIAIADYMSAHDESYPSVATIAANASMTERGVQKVLADAVAAGWLTATGANGCRRTFRVGWEQLATIDAPLRRNPRTTFTPERSSPVNHVHPTPEPRSPPPPNHVHPWGEPGSPEAGPVEATKGEATKPRACAREDVPAGAATVTPAPATPVVETPPLSPAAEAPRLPSWVPPATGCAGHPRLDVGAMVVRCVEAARQRTVHPARCGTDAAALLALWRKLGTPDPQAFAAEWATVCDWARSSPDKLAARDIRAEGWAEGRDRSSDVATLARQDRWASRLDAAQAWEAAGRVSPVPVPATAPPTRGEQRSAAMKADLAAWAVQSKSQQLAQGAK